MEAFNQLPHFLFGRIFVMGENHLGFVFSAATMPLYGGAATGEGVFEPSLIGIPLNVFIFSAMFLIQSTVLIFSLKQLETKE